MSGAKCKPAAKGNAPRGAGGPPAGKEAQRAARRIEVAGVDNPSASAGAMPRMQKRYHDEVRGKLQAEFGYKNVMQVPKLDKIVINMGVGEATGDQKKLDAEQRQIRDKNLLSTYASVQEIERLRDQRLTLLADQIKVTNQFLDTLNGRIPPAQGHILSLLD